jgi:hypothetical protein
MAEDAQQPSARFRPLRPASGARLILAFLLGPVLWIGAVVFGAWILQHTDGVAWDLPRERLQITR